jgi:anti-sigma B factor antagonist
VAIRRRQQDTIAILYPRGSFFGDAETDELQQAILGEAAAGNRRLVLNLSECEALNSIAIGVLMRAFTNYRGRSGDIRLCGLSRRLVDLFTMTKLIHVFGHFDSEEEAVASFAT